MLKIYVPKPQSLPTLDHSMSTPDHYAVIGNPIQHSKSPDIHRAFAAQTCQNLEYGRILGSAEHFISQVREFFANGGKGLNVTLPFKQQAWLMADQHSPRVKLAEAANTLLQLSNGAIFADNTDGTGLMRDLVFNNGVIIEDRSVLLLGAGGAARGVLEALLKQQPKRLWIANRTGAKAEALAARLTVSGFTGNIGGGGLDSLNSKVFDCIINATAAGVSGQIPVIPDGCLRSEGIVYDMFYADTPTTFVRWGQEHGASLVLDGLGMLVEQAAEAFLLWRGVRPDTKAVLRMLRP